MGKSKFPGKPSRLVNKKRVSVLSGAGLNTLASGTSSDEDNNQQQQQHQEQENSSTTEKLNQPLPIQSQPAVQQQKQNQQQPSAKVSTSLLDNEEIDQDGDDDVSKVSSNHIQSCVLALHRNLSINDRYCVLLELWQHQVRICFNLRFAFLLNLCFDESMIPIRIALPQRKLWNFRIHEEQREKTCNH